MNYFMKSVFRASLVFILFNGLVLVASLQVFAQAPGLIIVISSDTTWTKTDNPHTLTGPVFVGEDATLTVDTGVKLDFNGYYLLVNGTFVASGTGSERIQITNIERIEITQASKGWNEETGSGCAIENADISCPIYSSVSLKLTSCELSSDVAVGNLSLIDSCKIGGTVDAGSSTTISNTRIGGTLNTLDSNMIRNNILEGDVYVGNLSEILDITITADVYAGGCVVSRNSIQGSVIAEEISYNEITSGRYVNGFSILNNNIIGNITVDDQAVVLNNHVKGGYTSVMKDVVTVFGLRASISTYYGAVYIRGGSPTISNNVIEGGITAADPVSPIVLNNTLTNSGIYFPNPTVVPVGVLSGYVHDYDTADSPLIANNTVAVIKVSARSATISGNVVSNVTVTGGAANIFDNRVEGGTGIITNNGGVIEGNYLFQNSYGISAGSFGSVIIKNNIISDNDIGIKVNSNATVRNNTITNSAIGIEVDEKSVSATIERNLLSGNDVGLLVMSQAAIKNNTITDTGVAVKLENSPSVTIAFNNFEEHSQHSIYLSNTSNLIDVSNNWWGTTNTEAINISIRDYKYDFGLSKVTFMPILTEPNTEATSNPIPEFPAWLLLPLFLVATFAVVFARKKVVGGGYSK